MYSEHPLICYFLAASQIYN